MNRGIFFGLILVAYALPTAGCGGDDDDDDGGGDDSGDDSGGGGGAPGTGGSGGSMNVMCDPEGGGDCQNETDCPKVVSGDAREVAGDCGLECQAEDDPGACAVGCIVTDAEITQACAVCYATLVGCAAENCFTECTTDTDSAACTMCQIEAGCRTAFDACSGLTTVPPT
jgi:hypothetical protein